MPKQFNCAQCGIVLNHTRKALKGRIYDLIEPHECGEVETPEPGDATVFVPSDAKTNEPNYNQFEFVQKINDLSGKPSVEPEVGDRRPTDQVKSTAPSNLLEDLKNLPNSTPERDL